MAHRTSPPFRGDHVGSLLRPERLRQARADHKAGTIDDAELRAVEDDAIREVVAQQRDVGLQDATDGEFRRTSWHMDFIYSLEGVSQVEGESLHVQFRNEEGEYDYAPPAMHVDGKIGAARRRPDLRRRVLVPARHGAGRRHAQAHDPVAEHGPLPRRQLLDRPVGLPRHRASSGRT